MTEAKSTQPQLPPRPSGENSMKLNVEYIREWLADYKATLGNAIPSAGLPTSHVVGNVEWLLAENESLKAQLAQWEQSYKSAVKGRQDFRSAMKLARKHQAVAEAERDQALGVIREYQESHAHGTWGCPTCIKADALLSREEK